MPAASAEQTILGCEPTGHYWFYYVNYLEEHQIRLPPVNPYHV